MPDDTDHKPQTDNPSLQAASGQGKPAVNKLWLLSVAGLMWSGIGVMLARLAIGWLESLANPAMCFFAIPGLLLAMLIYRFGFSRLAEKNVRRIMGMKGKVCLFAFQKWTSYIIVVVMMTMGKMLRQLPIPRQYLASIYLGIGGALFLASLTFYHPVLAGLKAKPGK